MVEVALHGANQQEVDGGHLCDPACYRTRTDARVMARGGEHMVTNSPDRGVGEISYPHGCCTPVTGSLKETQGLVGGAGVR